MYDVFLRFVASPPAPVLLNDPFGGVLKTSNVPMMLTPVLLGGEGPTLVPMVVVLKAMLYPLQPVCMYANVQIETRGEKNSGYRS